MILSAQPSPLVLTGEPEADKSFNSKFSGLNDGHDEWLTPPEIIKSLGEFDLDPCSPINRPWPTAKQHFTRLDDGLSKSWVGRVWLNPPYGSETGKWLGRLAEHRNGIAFVFARTETIAFHQHVWPKADAILFLRGRVCFHKVDGSRAPMNAGAPSCLIAYGMENARFLRISTVAGAFVLLTSEPL